MLDQIIKEKHYEVLITCSEHNFNLNFLHLMPVSVTQKQTAAMFLRSRHSQSYTDAVKWILESLGV